MLPDSHSPVKTPGQCFRTNTYFNRGGPLHSPERSRLASGPHAALHHQCPLRSPKRSRCQYSKADASIAPATGNDFAISGDHHLQERRTSARRGPVNRALCRRSRVLFGDDRSDNQERRASARRGWTNPHQQRPAPFVSRPPMVCADCRCIRVYKRHGANVAPESFMGHTGPDYNRVHWRHGGLTPPAVALRCERLPAKNDFCDAQTYIRPGAAGVSPPWFAEPGAVRLQPRYVRRRPDRRPRAAGVSPPWVDKPASAETGAIRQQTTDGVCGLPLHSRL